MKAQDYVDKYLPLFIDVEDDYAANVIAFSAFKEFCDEVETIAKARSTTKVLSIIKEVGQKWNKFARLINEEQDYVLVNKDLFMDHWKRILKF